MTDKGQALGKNEFGPKTSNEKVRVLHCLGWLSTGGVERLRLFLAQHSDQSEFEHLVICQQAESWVSDIFIEHDWQVHEIGLSRCPFDIQWHRAALKIAKNYDPDVIHGAVFEGNILAIGLGLWLRKRKVFVEEASDATGRRFFGHLLMALLVKLSSGVVAVSPAVGDYLRGKLRVPSGKIKLVVNGVQGRKDVSGVQRRKVRKALGFRTQDLIIGSSGRLLDSHKKFSDLILATKAICSDFPNLRLVILGEGPDRSALEELVTKLELDEIVFFLGHREEPRDLIEILDVFALVSSGEAFGLALAEAAMAGVPCIATRVGGMPHILDYGRAGLLVRPNSPEQIADALQILLGSSNLRHLLGSRARERAEREFSIERYVSQIQNVWRGQE